MGFFFDIFVARQKMECSMLATRHAKKGFVVALACVHVPELYAKQLLYSEYSNGFKLLNRHL